MTNETKINKILNSNEFCDNILVPYIDEFKKYADKYSLFNYRDLIDKSNNFSMLGKEEFTLIELNNNKYLFISNFFTCIYDADTHKTLDLNQLVKEKYELESDVYLNTNHQQLENSFIESISYAYSYFTNSNNIPTCYSYLDKFAETKYHIYSETIKNNLDDYISYLDKIDSDRILFSKGKKASSYLERHNLLETNFNKNHNNFKQLYINSLYISNYFNILQKYKKTSPLSRHVFIPLTFFNITGNDTFECAYIFIDPENNKIILPKKNDIINLFKNQLLTEDSPILNSDYIENTYILKRHKQEVKTDKESQIKEIKNILTAPIKNLISTYNEEKKEYGEKFNFTTPLYCSKLLAPKIYNMYDFIKQKNIYLKYNPEYNNNNNIYSIVFNDKVIEPYSQPTAGNNVLNTIFMIDTYNRFQYKDKLYINVPDIISEKYSTKDTSVYSIVRICNNRSLQIEYTDSIPKVMENSKLRLKDAPILNKLDNNTIIFSGYVANKQEILTYINNGQFPSSVFIDKLYKHIKDTYFTNILECNLML